MAEYLLLSQGTCGGVGECHATGSRDTSLVSHRALVAQYKICGQTLGWAIAWSGGGRGKGGEDTWWINMTGRTSKLGCIHKNWHHVAWFYQSHDISIQKCINFIKSFTNRSNVSIFTALVTTKKDDLFKGLQASGNAMLWAWRKWMRIFEKVNQ